MQATIYHNPRCSKSRGALALLKERGIDCEVIEYLNDMPTRTVLARLIAKLGCPALDLVRTDEPEFQRYSGRTLNTDEVLDLLIAEPRLLQRPIVEVGAGACIARPPERLLALLE